MASFIGETIDRQIIFVVNVSVAGEAGTDPYPFSALLDTGAQTSMISNKAVQAVGLTAIGHMNIVPVTGNAQPTEKYRIRLDIPISNQLALPGGVIVPQTVSSGMDLEVGKLFYNPGNYDVLLGMDFITSFHITMYRGQYILSN